MNPTKRESKQKRRLGDCPRRKSTVLKPQTKFRWPHEQAWLLDSRELAWLSLRRSQQMRDLSRETDSACTSSENKASEVTRWPCCFRWLTCTIRRSYELWEMSYLVHLPSVRSPLRRTTNRTSFVQNVAVAYVVVTQGGRFPHQVPRSQLPHSQLPLQPASDQEAFVVADNEACDSASVCVVDGPKKLPSVRVVGPNLPVPPARQHHILCFCWYH